MSNRLAHRAGRLPPSVVPPEPPERGGGEPRPGWLIHWLFWGLILGLTLGMIAWSVLAPQAAAVKFLAGPPQPIRPFAEPGVMVLQAGVGADSCEKWTAARHAGGWGLGEQWILGFVSGVSVTGHVTHLAPLAETNVEGVFAWIDSYCQAHPDETLAHAGLEFVATHRG